MNVASAREMNHSLFHKIGHDLAEILVVGNGKMQVCLSMKMLIRVFSLGVTMWDTNTDKGKKYRLPDYHIIKE